MLTATENILSGEDHIDGTQVSIRFSIGDGAATVSLTKGDANITIDKQVLHYAMLAGFSHTEDNNFSNWKVEQLIELCEHLFPNNSLNAAMHLAVAFLSLSENSDVAFKTLETVTEMIES